MFIAQEVNKPWSWLLGFWECFVSGRCLHLKQYIPSCALSHQVNPSLKIGCCIICVFNAGYFEEFCKTLCSNSYDLTVYYMAWYNLKPQFRCMKYISIVLSAYDYTPGTSIHALNLASAVACPGFCRTPRLILGTRAENVTGDFCSALVVKMGSDQSFTTGWTLEHEFLCFGVSSMCQRQMGNSSEPAQCFTPLAQQGAFHFSPFEQRSQRLEAKDGNLKL